MSQKFSSHEESTLWAAFMTGGLSCGRHPHAAAEYADASLDEWKKRAEREDEKPADDAGAEDKSPEPPA